MASVSTTLPFLTLTDGAALSFAGQADRYRKNLAAITLLRQLQQEQRAPQDLTHEQRLTLAHYTAFGDSALLKRAFGGQTSDLDGLVSEAEAAKIKRTSLNAFYTSQDILTIKRSSGRGGSGRTPTAPSGSAPSTTSCSTARAGATSTAHT